MYNTQYNNILFIEHFSRKYLNNIYKNFFKFCTANFTPTAPHFVSVFLFNKIYEV